MLKILEMKWRPGSLAPAGSFAGQRVLVTGATAGLGLAAAVHLVNLGAAEVIITARSVAKGRAAKAKIEAETKTEGMGRVRVAELDMDNYASIVGLVDQLRNDYSSSGGLDFVILNAGTHNPSFVQSPTGLEQDIQVNAVSTALLGLLLVDWMKELRPLRNNDARLTFVTSGTHTGVKKTAEWESYAAEKPAAGRTGGILGHFSRAENWAGGIGGQDAYGLSKLLAQYAVEEVANLALRPDGSPAVIVTSVCPGLVGTDLSKPIADQSVFIKALIPVLYATVFQTPDVGARSYIDAGLAGPEQHGKFMRRYITDAEYAKRAEANVTSSHGRTLQRLVWGEIREELRAKVPSAQRILG